MGLSLETNYYYVIRRVSDGHYVSGIHGIYYTDERSSAQVFASEEQAATSLRNAVMRAKETEFEIVEYGMIPTMVTGFTLTTEDRAKFCLLAKNCAPRNVHQRDGRYFVTYLGYEYIPEDGNTQFDLDAMCRSRGKRKLKITAEGLHWNENKFGNRKRPSTIFVHGKVGGEVVIETWKKGKANPGRGPKRRRRR